ncbi:MAG: radical SAM protein [Candidatus Omnitrophica bacterium]|nr:radical SAM protein [Candidatus Omnitrophota bacterium]
MPRVKELIFSITNRCNLRCKMCDIPSVESEELTTEELKNVINDAAKFGFSTFVFSGGEPLLRKDIFGLIAFAKKNHLTACITSNGCLIDEKVARQLSQAGTDVVNVSIDGPQEVHDYLRGKNSFDKAIKALKNLAKYRVETTLATMVCAYNYRFLIYLVKLSERYNVGTIKFQPFSRIFINDISRGKNFLIEKRDLAEAINVAEEVIELSREYKISTNPKAYLRRIPFYLSGKKITPQYGCNALWSTCSINSRGDIFPCWAFNNGDKLIGNVRKNKLFELWNSKRHEEIRRTIFKEGCPGCMMSCYDEVFGQDEQKGGLLKKVKKINKVKTYKRRINRFIQGLRSEVTQLKLRYRFYKSYRGSFKGILRRIVKNFPKRINIRNMDDKNEVERTLTEVELSKKKLRKELSKYK